MIDVHVGRFYVIRLTRISFEPLAARLYDDGAKKLLWDEPFLVLDVRRNGPWSDDSWITALTENGVAEIRLVQCADERWEEVAVP